MKICRKEIQRFFLPSTVVKDYMHVFRVSCFIIFSLILRLFLLFLFRFFFFLLFFCPFLRFYVWFSFVSFSLVFFCFFFFLDESSPIELLFSTMRIVIHRFGFEFRLFPSGFSVGENFVFSSSTDMNNYVSYYPDLERFLNG